MAEGKIGYGNKKILKNSLWSLFFKASSAFISFFSAPLLLSVLGEEKYGAWASMLSLISWIYYCDIGIGSSMRNKVAASVAEDDYVRAQKYVGVSYATVSLISLVLFALVFIITRWFSICDFLGIKISGENLNDVLLVAFALACINFVASLVNNVLYAVQKSATVSFYSVLAQLFFLILLGVYAYTGIEKILWVAVGEGFCQLLKNVIESTLVYREYPELSIPLRRIEWSYSGEIFSLGIMMFIGQMAALILNATDNLVISKYLSVMDVTPYSFCYKYFNMINSVYVALITPLLSAYTMAYTQKDILWIKGTVKKNGMLYVIFGVGTILAMLIFEPFAGAWLGKKLDYGSSLIISTMIYFVILMFNHIWSTMLTGFGRIKESTIACVVGTVCNVPVSIFLATNCGLGTTGVIAGSIISLLPSTLVNPYFAIKEMKKIR